MRKSRIWDIFVLSANALTAVISAYCGNWNQFAVSATIMVFYGLFLIWWALLDLNDKGAHS